MNPYIFWGGLFVFWWLFWRHGLSEWWHDHQFMKEQKKELYGTDIIEALEKNR